ncbi:hypothetical protein HYPSUDRAFT_40176 [Hypholoma sublateritium FD-334 SS-4]|uniref:Uncharacterized protein n=1 Tax=Hypholoma sublateritium (strain FD-334 SS-4) TaxID=945553 RepID=A0A0D2L7E9_HYPSF|nr:hypothetical protein HYPSUDRAFT_40176 [Hypholoma sublateritium FD-334 SS-4]
MALHFHRYCSQHLVSARDIAQQHYRQVAEMVTQGNVTSSPPSGLVLINS